MHVAASASTANLGSGFDAAAAALDLWNELEVEDGAFAVELEGEGADELPCDASHLALRAFVLFAPLENRRFRFLNRIPLERGLGSSASAIALGLVAGAAAAGRPAAPAELLALGERFEGHVDNLAAVLLGGVCVAWRRDGAPHARRIADDMPLAAIVAVPGSRISTARSRTGLPATVPHEDAAANAAAAMLLGTAIASGDATLLGDAFEDRLHEGYRAESAPLLGAIRAQLPEGAVAVTLSGSGPSVVIWAETARADEVAESLRASLRDDAAVLRLGVARRGAHLTD
jgi:homoserine kinase